MLGQNVLAAGALTLGMSLILVLLVALISVGLGLGHTIGLADLALVSRWAAARSPRSPCWPPPSGWRRVRCASAGISTT